MKRLAFIFLNFLTVGLSLHGQENSITEFDLYGCWVLERLENGRNSERIIYKRCGLVNPKMKIKSSEFSLHAFGKSEIQRWSPNICPATFTDYGTWTLDENSGIIIMSYGQKWLKELKRRDPEEYENFGSPEKLEWKKFKVLSFSKNEMEIEKTTGSNVYN